MSESNTFGAGEKAKRGLFRSLRMKLIVHLCASSVAVLLLVMVVAIVGVPFTPFVGQSGEQKAEAFRSLRLVADLKKDRLMRWLEERRDDVTAWAKNPMMREFAAHVRSEVLQEVQSRKSLDDAYALVRDREHYQTVLETLYDIQETHGVYALIQIADAESGKVLVSTEGTDLGMDISIMPVFGESLKSGGAATSVLEKDEQVPFSHFHVCHPIKNEAGKNVAGLFATIDCDQIIRPMLHTGDGLGEHGEALMVDENARIMASLKYPLADGSTAAPFVYQIKAEAAKRAARGEEGMIEANDYRGVPVLAAYRHIPVGDDWGWGLVVKRDKAELYAPIRRNIYYAVMFGALAIAVVILLTSALASTITKPIHSLIVTAKKVESGDLSVRAPVKAMDDVGRLTAVFNTMVQRIQGWREELERQVAERTADLKNAKQELEIEVGERKIAQKNLQERNDFLNNVLESLTHPFYVVNADDYSIMIANSATQQQDFTEGATCYAITHRGSEPCCGDLVCPMEEVKKTKQPVVVEHVHYTKEGRPRNHEVHGYPILDEEGNVVQLIEYYLDITARKRSEEIQRVSKQFLDIANQHTSFHSLLEACVAEIKSLVGCAAVGVRVLDEDGNIPYEAYDGFSDHFYGSEGNLSIRTDQCLCVSVIKGLMDPGAPICTEAGSCCIGSTSRFIASASDEDKQETRNVCNAEGYESVALIPLRLGDQILGLIHIADPREDVFPPELIELLEAASVQLGLAIQRIWAMENLRKQEHKYRHLVESSRDIVWRINTAGRFTFLSPAVHPMMGYDPEDLIGESLEVVMAPSSLEDARETWRRRIDGKLPREGVVIEFTHRRKDGTEFVGESQTSPVYAENGDLLEVEGITRDVTERKRAEEAREWGLAVNAALSRLYKPLVALSGGIDEIAVTIYDEARRLTDSAHGYVSTIDSETGDLVSRTLSEMLEGQCEVSGPDRRICFPCGEDGLYPGLWGHSLNTRQPMFTNDPLTHPTSKGLPEGHVPMKNFLAVPVMLGKELVGQIALANTDKEYEVRHLEAVGRLAEYYALAIQHHRSSEALREERDKARLYFDIAGVMLVALDSDQRVRLINRKGCEILGCSEEEIVGRNWFDNFVPAEERGKTREAFQRSIADDRVLVEYSEDPIITNKGERRLVAWRNTLLHDIEGKTIGTLSSGEDITERKRAETQLRQSLEEKEILLRELYHRVKNNLQVICSLLRLTARTIDDPGAKRAFEYSEGRVRSMALVHEKLYQSKNLVDISFREYVEGLSHQLVRAHAGERQNIVLKTDVDEVTLDLETAVPCALMINELLSNALRHGFPDGRQGEIEISLHESPNEQVELIVSDNGVGLPKDMDYRKSDSLGLRLVIMLGENQLHGEFEVEQADRTSFKVRFPKSANAKKV